MATIIEAGTTRREDAMSGDDKNVTKKTFHFNTDDAEVRKRFAAALDLNGEHQLAAEILGQGNFENLSLLDKVDHYANRAITMKTVVRTGLAVGIGYGVYRGVKWGVNKFFPTAQEVTPTAHVVQIDSGQGGEGYQNGYQRETQLSIR